MFSFLRKTLLWLLLAPYAVWGLGLASNQAVLIANHDKFPVMLNARKLNKILSMGEESELEAILGIKAKAPLPAPDTDGMIDDVHCVMTTKTHLNALADVFDIGSIYSIGDFMLGAGDASQPYCLFAWILLMSARAARQPE
jgi:hypothetical protein